jgi:hypothetical protein
MGDDGLGLGPRKAMDLFKAQLGLNRRVDAKPGYSALVFGRQRRRPGDPSLAARAKRSSIRRSRRHAKA